MEIEIGYRILKARTRYGNFICEITERQIVKFENYTDSEYGSVIYMEGADKKHALKVNVINEPNVIHSWNDILGIHLNLMKKNALLAEQETNELRQAVQCYFHDSGVEIHKPINGDRIPLWDGEWEHQKGQWIYSIERFNNINESYVKDKITRTRIGKSGEYNLEEIQSVILGRTTRQSPVYPLSPEGIINVFN